MDTPSSPATNTAPTAAKNNSKTERTPEQRLEALETAVGTIIAALDKMPNEAAELILQRAREQTQQQQQTAPAPQSEQGPTATASLGSPLSDPRVAQLLPVLMQFASPQQPTEDPLMAMAKEKMLRSMDLTNQLAEAFIKKVTSEKI